MDRRAFIKAALAIPAIAALPAPTKAAEELLDGVIWVSHSWFDAKKKINLVETWSKSGGKIWRCIATEDRLISITEEPFCPFVPVPYQWSAPNA